MRKLIKDVSREVTAQASSCCKCKFHLEDEYGKYEGYTYHKNWQVWEQEHDNVNFKHFLKCTGCGYELAKQYWKDLDGKFVDYLGEPRFTKTFHSDGNVTFGIKYE
mgnify:FL=1